LRGFLVPADLWWQYFFLLLTKQGQGRCLLMFYNSSKIY
jgi:hypothetical protein